MIRCVKSASPRLLGAWNRNRCRFSSSSSFPNRFHHHNTLNSFPRTPRIKCDKNRLHTWRPALKGAVCVRHASVFSGWNKEWHHPDFLRGMSVRDKEAWLESMLKSNSKAVDIEAYLVVLNALADSELQDPEAPRRAERWMSRLRRDHLLYPTAECYQAVIQAWAN